MWETLYEHIHTLLKELHGVKTLSHTQIVDLYEKYDEHFQKAVEHKDAGQFKDALLSINKAISLCPGETYPYVIKGMALRSFKRWKDLLSTMKTLRGLGSVPQDEETLSYFYSGYAHAEMEEAKKAITDLRKVVKRENENLSYYPEALFILACCYAETGDQKKALSHLEKAVYAGYDDLAELKKDKRLENLTNTKEFETIVDALKNRVERIVKKYLLSGDQESRVFRSLSEFPIEKLLKAKEYCVKLKRGEKILAIHDTTVFGGAKEGICFTNKAVYGKALFAEPIEFRYADITSIEDSEDSFKINGVPFCCDAKEWHELIAQMLRKICRV